MAGFVGGMELSLPFFTGEDGLMDSLEPVLGDVRVAGETDGNSCWILAAGLDRN